MSIRIPLKTPIPVCPSLPLNNEETQLFLVDDVVYCKYQDQSILLPADLTISTYLHDRLLINLATNGNAPYICECGSEFFNVLATADYETSAECANCGKMCVVHDG